jgi:hypothetical protein
MGKRWLSHVTGVFVAGGEQRTQCWAACPATLPLDRLVDVISSLVRIARELTRYAFEHADEAGAAR